VREIVVDDEVAFLGKREERAAPQAALFG
jgi:hypothetical protein